MLCHLIDVNVIKFFTRSASNSVFENPFDRCIYIWLIPPKSVHNGFFNSPRKHAVIFYCFDTFKADMLT